MATRNKVSFSGQNKNLEDVALYYLDVRDALADFFAGSSTELQQRYAGEKLDDARDKALEELDSTSCLAVLTSVEAAVRIDYLNRVYDRKKDKLSKAMREIHNTRNKAARLEDDLLRVWCDAGGVGKTLINQIIGAFKYRHWLAHGRYWTPKFGNIYDYITVYALAEEFLEAMDQY